ncbi:MAG: membrane protein insertion efficiency factor YidD [Candidatus Doudnabacteria bacterium RIFCSPHIGHO2_01_FULL_49_9]|uniref:Putative membrane protein insertion efficiency factor n=1 Tax=Candidatus Doudnabacteria bacterium RIFCSPHIGHO2_01_FULL_49_9 TaxID=1817827 RepID=A0A1F5P3B6_9BACT|nr:MAG: membrane protein insertion efficiency factor YidD [Candidatus Doudnabacteria bacterium RIFCSPHIGHO2_01_FULL_49_9]
MISIVISLINLYQRFLSPDHSAWGKARHPYGYCRFYPTCSEYAKQAVLSHGLWLGGTMAIWRVLRCNPFANPGFDPVRKNSN